MVTVAVSAIVAVAELRPTLMASAPATPVSPPLAPEVAFAANVLVVSVAALPSASKPAPEGASACAHTWPLAHAHWKL